jgi:hypothetical protein
MKFSTERKKLFSNCWQIAYAYAYITTIFINLQDNHRNQNFKKWNFSQKKKTKKIKQVNCVLHRVIHRNFVKQAQLTEMYEIEQKHNFPKIIVLRRRNKIFYGYGQLVEASGNVRKFLHFFHFFSHTAARSASLFKHRNYWF